MATRKLEEKGDKALKRQRGRNLRRIQTLDKLLDQPAHENNLDAWQEFTELETEVKSINRILEERGKKLIDVPAET